MQHRSIDVSEVLLKFGLSENESKVYLSLLALGVRPASVIAKHANLKRAHTYNVLTGLIEKGIVQEFEKSGVRQFACSSPSSLVTILETRERELKESKDLLLKSLPILDKLQNPLHAPPKVKFYSGLQGIKETIYDTLRYETDGIYAFVDPATTWYLHSAELTVLVNEYIKERIERNVWFYSIQPYTNEGAEAMKQSGYFEQGKRKVKVLNGLTASTEIMIYGDKVAMISTANALIGVIIEDKGIADSLRSLHQTLWNILPDYNLN